MLSMTMVILQPTNQPATALGIAKAGDDDGDGYVDGGDGDGNGWRRFIFTVIP